MELPEGKDSSTIHCYALQGCHFRQLNGRIFFLNHNCRLLTLKGIYMKERETEITVNDRRMFNPDGTLREAYKAQSALKPEPEKLETEKPVQRAEEPASKPAKTRPEGINQSFTGLIEMLTMNALIHLGAHPQMGRGGVNLEAAREFIEMLSVLEEKTKENLSVEEERILTEMIARLRMEYVGVANQISTSAKKQ